MNGVHDMGGMNCFGPVEREKNEPVFHADWERRVFALSLATGGLIGPIDRSRHARERMDPASYLRATYYERWLAGLVMRAKEFGLLSDEEIAGGKARPAPAKPGPPPDAKSFAELVRTGRPSTRDTGRLEPRFAVGDRVRARDLNPIGHTRLPRYARGRVGTVAICHGTHVFPDTNAHDEGENPQPLYSVCFAATELWGADAPRQDRLYIDLWEDYLEPIET